MHALISVTFAFLFVWLAGFATAVTAQQSESQLRPNFLLVVADDLGWADIGAFGSAIRTPNIDKIAADGTIMSQFYAGPTCAPSRAMLLTGLSSHEAGVGTQNLQQAPNQKDSIVYQGQLHDGVVTLAEGLQSIGYQTMISGKWHIGRDTDQQPHRRGFQRSFVLREGGASHFADQLALNPAELPRYFEDGVPVDTLPADFYSTTFYTQKMIDFLDARDRSRPFFSYLAYTAPHDPLQVPDDWLHRYRGVFDNGPESVRARRIAALQARGLFPAEARASTLVPPPPILPGTKPPWTERSEAMRRVDVRGVEIYAAMVELLDQNLGRVIAYLEAEGELDNTFVVFLSDNGVSAITPLFYPQTSREWLHQERDMDPANAGRPGTHTYIDGEWASALNGPLRLFKGTTADGGTRVPFIVAGPTVAQGVINKQLGHVADITPTFYALAGLQPQMSAVYRDKPYPRGSTLEASWQGLKVRRQQAIITELFGDWSVRDGDWKLSRMAPPFGDNTWQLFNMTVDPGETLNVAAENPLVVEQMQRAYVSFAKEVGVIEPKPPLTRDVGALYVGKCNWSCEARLLLLNALVNPSDRWILVVAVLLLGLLTVLLGRRLLRRHQLVDTTMH
ncbi:MAG: sulfatase-like hydrolase/transferase [Proteobacteria bacterium]|nr:sulfatase-like hydrolase/transferase [Pseudomonadota bacterium]